MFLDKDTMDCGVKCRHHAAACIYEEKKKSNLFRHVSETEYVN